MPAFDSPERPAGNSTAAADSNISFPPVTKDHILHCSYDYWFPKYRSSCIKSRIIKLSPEFIEYIREDGIILASDDGQSVGDEDDDWEPTSTAYSRHSPEDAEEDSDSEEDEAEAKAPRLPPNERFPEIHQAIKDIIKELGGQVAPKLNWSSPKDAAWISPHQNTIKCTAPNDVYLLLKSSNFITHDLEHAFDGTVTTSSSLNQPAVTSVSDLGFQPVLVLRSFFTPHQALEFRCFVKQRNLVAIAQRDLNHYNFLLKLRPAIIARIKDLFDSRLRLTFPDGNFCFDVYIPEVHNLNDDTDDSEEEDPGKKLGRARLIDINPWAPRTDTLLFGWDELLDLHVPKPLIGVGSTNEGIEEGVVRLHIGEQPSPSDDDLTTEDEEEEDFEPELRLVEKDDPAAYNFSSPQYSAHKLPKEVVDASTSGAGGLREFAQQWNEMSRSPRTIFLNTVVVRNFIRYVVLKSGASDMICYNPNPISLCFGRHPGRGFLNNTRSCQLATICLRGIDIDQSFDPNRAFDMMQSRGRPNRITKPTAAARRPNRRIDDDQLAQRFSTADEDSDLYQAVHRAAAAAANADAQHHIDDAGDVYKDDQGQEDGDDEDGDAEADADPDAEHGHGPHVDVMDHDMPMAPMTPNQHHHPNHDHHHQAIELTPSEMLQDPSGMSYAAAAAATDIHSSGPPPPPVGSTMPAPQPLVAATDFQPNPPPPSTHNQPPQQAPPQTLAPVPSQPPHKTTEQMAHESGYNGFKVDSAFAKRMSRDPGQRLAEQRRHGQDLNLVRRSNVEALFAQIAGSEAANPCAHCRKGQGPWTICVVYSGQMMGSCANCWFNASGSRCSFHEKSQPIQPAQHPYATVPVPVPIPGAHPPGEQPGGGYAPGASPAQLQAAALWSASTGLFSHDAGVKGTVQNALLQVRQATPYQRALIEVEVAAKQLALKIVAAEELAATVGGDEGDVHEYDSPPGDGVDDGAS